jgi:hypothetical protein
MMSSYKQLTSAQQDMLLTKLAELATVASPGSTGMTKKASSTLSATEKNQLVNQLFSDPTGRGLKRIAYAMTEPLRTKLDYVGIGRKLIETDLLPQGVLAEYDKDFPEVPAIKISARGNPPTVESWSDRVEVPTFEIATVRTIKYQEISQRRFNALDRTKNKAAFELKIAEDDVIFSAINTAATTANQNTVVSGNLSRASLATAFANVEAQRLAVGNILMHPYGFRGIRGTWTQADLDQVNMQGLVETGWAASLWNSKIFVTDRLNQLATGFTTALGAATTAGSGAYTVFVLALPAQLGRFPIRYDVEVKPFDYPPERQVVFSVYESIGVTVFNATGVATVSIN